MRTKAVPMEIQQPDLTLHRDALECMSKQSSPDAACLSADADGAGTSCGHSFRCERGDLLCLPPLALSIAAAHLTHCQCLHLP